jgi:ComF family protein
MLDAILNLLFPIACILCDVQVLERCWGPVCFACWGKMTPLQRPFCEQCGMPAPAIEGLCSSCRLHECAFDFARSALIFNDPAREVIHHLKYSDRVSLAKPLGKLLQNCLEQEGFQGEVIAPVPLHRRRERERGFNQAELLAVGTGFRVDTGILKRSRNTKSQTGLSRSQRTLNLAGSFQFCARRAPRCLIVLDDVFTTGATMHEVAKTLKRAGVERVEVLTVARVLRSEIP